MISSTVTAAFEADSSLSLFLVNCLSENAFFLSLITTARQHPIMKSAGNVTRRMNITKYTAWSASSENLGNILEILTYIAHTEGLYV